MIAMPRELNRLSGTLVVRGALMFVLGVSAAAWPEPLLIAAMNSVGVLALILGAYEVAIARSMRSYAEEWRIPLHHGGASIAFGLLTLGGPRLPLRLGLAATAAWFLLYAWLARAAALASPSRTVRRALLSWSLFNVSLAIVAMTYRAATIFALLFFGAVYAATFGVWQLAAGLWVRRLGADTEATHTRIAREVESRVQAALPLFANGQPQSVAVHFDGACATLTGDVNCWSEHQAAGHAALSVRGVQRVDNQLALLVVGKISHREHFHP